MQTEQNRLMNFERIVLNEAMENKKNVTQRIKKEHDSAVRDAQDEINAHAERRYAKEIDGIVRKNNEMLVKHNTELRQQLITKRNILIEQLFEKVTEDLRSYAQSKKYSEYMDKAVRAAAEELGEGGLQLIINNADRRHSFKFDGVPIEYTDDDMIGGFVMINRDTEVLIDESFALKLEKQRAGFLDLCRVKL